MSTNSSRARPLAFKRTLQPTHSPAEAAGFPQSVIGQALGLYNQLGAQEAGEVRSRLSANEGTAGG